MSQKEKEAKKTEKSETLEEMFLALEEVIKRLEEGDSSLEEAFGLYKRGVDLLKDCNDTIDKVEKQILILDGEAGSGE